MCIYVSGQKWGMGHGGDVSPVSALCDESPAGLHLNIQASLHRAHLHVLVQVSVHVALGCGQFQLESENFMSGMVFFCLFAAT